MIQLEMLNPPAQCPLFLGRLPGGHLSGMGLWIFFSFLVLGSFFSVTVSFVWYANRFPSPSRAPELWSDKLYWCPKPKLRDGLGRPSGHLGSDGTRTQHPALLA